MLRMYGASDDLIQFEGAVDAELETHAELHVLVGTEQDGLIVSFEYDYPFIPLAGWTAKLTQTRETGLFPWAVRGGTKGHSVLIEIDCPAGTPVLVKSYDSQTWLTLDAWKARASR